MTIVWLFIMLIGGLLIGYGAKKDKEFDFYAGIALVALAFLNGLLLAFPGN